MAAPFLDVSVLPMYGQLRARIMWRLQIGFESGRVFVFESPDGLNNWRELGNVPSRESEFLDEHLIARGRLDEAYYRVVLRNKARTYESDVISTFGKLTRSEFGMARVIMMHEWDTLVQFTAIKFFKLRSDGERCVLCVDKDTGQMIGTSLCPVCYGTGFEGGFYPSIDSFMHIGNMSTKIQSDSREGVGSSDMSTIKVRTMSYPLMEKNDLIVNPSADKRYLIESIDYGMFHGKVPVYAEMQIQLLPRNDIRYTVPLS
jgi:hypothetical protein